MTDNGSELKHIILKKYDIYKDKLLILSKNIDNEKIKDILKTEDINTILNFLYDLYNEDKFMFYKLCSIEQIELGDLIFERGNLNGIDIIYQNMVAKKQRKISKTQKLRKLESYYKIKRILAKNNYEKIKQTIESNYQIEKCKIMDNNDYIPDEWIIL